MESSVGTRESAGQMSNGSNLSGGSSSGGSVDGEENEINNNPDTREHRDRTEAWWSVNKYLDSKNLTHQSAKFSLTGNRVFGNHREEVWDLSDSLMELYEAIQRKEGTGIQQIKRMRNDPNNLHVDVNDWLSKDISHGFIRVYAPDMTNFFNSRLVPVTLSTTVQQVTHSLGLSMNSLHVQLNGDIIRRMDTYEHPLVIQNDYLNGLGFDDITRIQEEGVKPELGYLIRFYSGKPMFDSTFSRNQLQAFLEIKKGGVLQNWLQRLCVLSGTRLLIYKDKYKRTAPHVVQLAQGSVEDARLKGRDFCLRLTSTINGERVIFLAFPTETEYNRWFKKCKKATDKLPTSADLSNCHLEFLPENIFVNDQLSMLNLRHNILKERPIEEDIFIIGWLDDLSKFTKLRSLNLADNSLLTFPLSVCQIRTLVELNIASNKLEEIPPDIADLTNLQALHIHNNHLTSLPDEMIHLRKLFILVLAFNRFSSVPPVVAQMTNIRVSEIENIIMAGNCIDHIPSETLMEMKYVKKVDLRMNQLTLLGSETMKFSVLEHLTHLDIRDNQVHDLDIRLLKTLEYLNCERNDMVLLKLNGLQLKNLFASQNCLESIHINPKPEYLSQIDLSYNQIRQLPDWLSDCFFLQKVNVSFNLLTELPARLFIDAQKLKVLKADHNHLRSLPTEVDVTTVEEVYVHHNLLGYLPDEFFINSNKLRVFNASKNRLIALPPVNPIHDLNKLQELYLTCNSLSDSAIEVISGFARLKVLHIAHNEIRNISDRHIQQLELLQELNISGNELRSLPKSLGALSKLVVLRAHSNVLSSLPDFHGAKSLRVLDVGHNQLYNISVTNLMASQLNLLDMSLNTQLKVDPKEFKSVKNRKSICLVDATGQNRALPGLKRQSRTYEDDEMDLNIPWKVGFSETSGIRNKLCVGTLKLPKFRDENDSLFAMFDGGHNNEVPKILMEKLPDIMKAELSHNKTEHKYMKYAILTAHRTLKATGQKLGASGVVLHIERVARDKMNMFNLVLGNVGDVEVILCRHSEALVLTRKFVTQEDPTECERVQHSDGIITEDCKVNGVSKNTRMLGCAFLYPHIIPMPYTCEVSLRNDDEFLIVANKGLWKYITYGHAVEEIYEIGNPVVAAKHLQDLAQGYGSKENISVLVIRLNTDREPSLGRLRPRQQEMSIDDVEAAARHDALRAKNISHLSALKDRSNVNKPNHKVPVIVEKPSKVSLPAADSVSSLGQEDGSTDTLTIENVDRHCGRVMESGSHSSHVIKKVSDSVHTDENFNAGRKKSADISNKSSSTIQNSAPPAVQLVRRPAGSVYDSDRNSIHSNSNASVRNLHGSTSNGDASNLRNGDKIKSNNSVGKPSRTVNNHMNSDASKGSSTNFILTKSPLENRLSSGDVAPAQRPATLIGDDIIEKTSLASVNSELEEPKEGSPSMEALPTLPCNKDLRPLPNQRFVKKNAAQEWEVLLQRRLSSDVKDKELKQIGSIISSGDLNSENQTVSTRSIKQASVSDLKDSDMVLMESIGRNKGKRVGQATNSKQGEPVGGDVHQGKIMRPVSGQAKATGDNQTWFVKSRAQSPAPLARPAPVRRDFIKIRSTATGDNDVQSQQEANEQKLADVRSRIAMFENLKKNERSPSQHPEESRRMFFSPARSNAKPAVNVPPRRCFSPPPSVGTGEKSIRAQTAKSPVDRSMPNSTRAATIQSEQPVRRPLAAKSVTSQQQNAPSQNVNTVPQKSPPAVSNQRPSDQPAAHISPERPSYPASNPPPANSRRQLPHIPEQKRRPALVTQKSPTSKTSLASNEKTCCGSVENDLYSKVKRVKKDTPTSPKSTSSPPTSAEETADVVEVSYL